MNKQPSLLICGSLAYDELFSYSGCIQDHLTNQKAAPLYVNIRAHGPRVRRGGCGGNIAWTTAQFSIPASVFSWVGGDGGEYIRFLSTHGLDTSQIVIDSEKSTPRAILLSDNKQDQFLLFSSQEIPSGWKTLKPENCSLAVVTAGVPEKTSEIVHVLKEKKIPYIIDPGKFILDITREDLLYCINGADTLVVNRYEKELLIKQMEMSWIDLSASVRCAIVTEGEKGSIVATYSGKERIAAVMPSSLRDPYGAGDAFLAGYCAGRLLEYTPEWAARIGSVVASFAVEIDGAQEHTFNADAFMKRLESAYGKPKKSLSEAYFSVGLPTGSFMA